MKRVFLIGCGKSKLDRPAPASQLYTGQLFRKSLAYAEAELGPRRDGEIYVLSALHGLVLPDQQIDPYDTALLRRSKLERAVWGREVAAALRQAGHFSADVALVFLAGSAYVRPVIAALDALIGIDSEMPYASVPMDGLGIGERLAWLTDQLQLRRCRVCGCTQWDCQRCVERTGELCSWVGADLCSACQDWRPES